MKIIALILSVIIISLASLPTIEACGLLPYEMSCTEFCDKENQEHESEENDDCNEVCNPFLSCHCCFGFILPSQKIIPKQITEYQEKMSVEVTLLISFHFITIWNPPKV